MEEGKPTRRRKKAGQGGLAEVMEMATMMETMTRKEKDIIRALLMLVGAKRKRKGRAVVTRRRKKGGDSTPPPAQ